MDFTDLWYRLRDHGLENVFRIFYGVYRGVVLRNDDPEERGRVQVSCPVLGHNPKTPVDVWVDPAHDITGARMGWFNPPLVNSVVRVAFDRGDPALPMAYFGGWWTKSGGTQPVPTEFGYVDKKPQRRGFRSRAGHYLQFDDTPGSEAVRLVWHKINSGDEAYLDPDKVSADPQAGDKLSVLSFDSDGTIQLRDAAGSMVALNATTKEIVVLDANGNLISTGPKGLLLSDKTGTTFSISDGVIQAMASKAIVLNAPNVTLKAGGVFLGDGAGLSAAIAEQLTPWLGSHTHTGVTAGPATSGPPAGPPPPAKSAAVKLK